MKNLVYVYVYVFFLDNFTFPYGMLLNIYLFLIIQGNEGRKGTGGVATN